MNNTVIALNDNQKIIGVCSFGPARRKKYANFGEIYTLYVLPEFQHQGIGKKLFQTALNNLSAKFVDFYLIVLKNNLPSRAFYEMFGFKASNDLMADQTKYGLLHEIVYTKKVQTQ